MRINFPGKSFLSTRALFRCAASACVAALVFTAPAFAQLVTFEDVKRISPSARDDFARAIADAREEFEAAGIDTRLRMAHFLAQVMTETGGLGRLDENMNYSYRTLLRVFSRRTVSEPKAREIAGQPRRVANWVYGHRLGNRGRHTDDGWNYRGSGYIQLTGRDNFRRRGAEIGLPLEDDPEMARRVPEGLSAALAYWTARDINAAADDHDRYRVRVLVNGPAAHGYPQAKIWFNRAWLRVFQDKEAEGFELADAAMAVEAGGGLESEAELFDNILSESGLLSGTSLESAEDPDALRAEALRAYQEEMGLPVTGELDADTQEALLDPREWRHQDDAAEPPAEIDLEETVTFRLEDRGREEAEMLEAFEGTGRTIADPSMPEPVLQTMTEAAAVYPEYEMGSAGVTPETHVPFSVFEPDQRTAVVDTTTFPNRAIVQILFETPYGRQGLCTGAMVSADTLLTAAHCLHSGTVNGRLNRNFNVIPARDKGSMPFGQCRGTRAFILRGWTEAVTSTESRYFDLGALRVDCSVGEETGWLGVRSLADDEADAVTRVQGYSADKAPAGRQWTSEDRLHLLWAQKGFYRNDTFGGTSGSPVFVSDEDRTIVGVHTNGAHGEPPWASFNAFTRITPERLARVRDWISF